MQEKIKNLQELSNKIKEITTKKLEAVAKQDYELASSYRDEERTFIGKIDKIVEIKEEDFQGKEFFDVVKKDLYKVICFIEDGDTNLTPALLRKLINDTKKVKEENEILKNQLKKELTWIGVDEGRPKLVEDIEIGDKTLLLSNEVAILYISENEKFNVCIGRYVVEEINIHDRKYYFVSNDSDKVINLIDIKGWQDSTDKAAGWFKLPELKIKL